MSPPVAGRGTLLALMLLPFAAPAAAADLASYRFTRPLDVPAPGPVEVPLDLAVLHHLGSGGLAVFDPDGREVTARLRSDQPYCCRVRADLVEARREGETWHVVLDLGPTPPLHEQLQFRIRRMTSAPAVRLEGSDDRQAWRFLTEGDLFRLGTGEELESTALTYPPNRHRYLRLLWPAAAGTPELRRVLVVGPAGRTLSVRGAGTACRREGSAAVCALPLAAPEQVGVRLFLRLLPENSAGGAAGTRVGYRLSEPFLGGWRRLAEGTAAVGPGATVIGVPLPAAPLPSEPLRLELYGEAGPPRLAGWSLELAQPLVAFEAPHAGRYTLAYGGGERRPGESEAAAGPEREPASAAVERPAAGSARWVVPGPDRAQELPPLPPAATAPGAPLGDTAFGASWPVRAPRVKPGEIVRLELPATVLAASYPSISDVRLAVGGRQLPYVHLSPDAPALAAAAWGLRPRPQARSSKSRVDLAVEPTQWVDSVSLTAAPPFRRWITVSTRLTQLPLLKLVPNASDVLESDEGFWDCYSSPPLPCRREIAHLPGLATDRVTIRFDDRDNPPVAAVDVALWRQREVLVFVWPAAAEVRLLTDAVKLAAPRYDLELLAPQLLARPWRLATVDLGGGPAAAEPFWQPWLLPAALALAGIALLLLLRRLLMAH